MDEQIGSSGFKLSKKTVLGILVFAFIVIATGIGVYLAQQKQIFTPKAYEVKPVSGPETSFTLSNPGTLPLQSEFRISILAKSDIEAANLFVAKLKFPTDLLEVAYIDKGAYVDPGERPDSGVRGGGGGFTSFIKRWIENDFDNSVGTISLVGGVQSPGYKTITANPPSQMADVVFRTKGQAGVATISFDPESAIYRDSDNANILNIKRESVFKIELPQITITPIPTGVISVTPPITYILGDVNGDGKISLVDMSALLSKWGKSGTEAGRADINKDGVVNTVDYSLMINILIEHEVIKGTSQLPRNLQPPSR